MAEQSPNQKGAGAYINPDNRFSAYSKGDDYDDIDPEEAPESLKTKYIEVFPKTIVNEVKSPDLGFYYSLNPYQGCEHGCTYCYARPTHEYWGYSAGTDFERIILVKQNAPQLLAETLRKKSWKVKPISLSGNTDCYQPCERTFGITRRLLEVMLEFRQPVSIITKNALILKDLDILKELASMELVQVNMSITTLDESLRRKLEPRTATAKRKLEAVRTLTDAGIPVNVMVAPVIPALNDHELFAITEAAAQHGALSAHHLVVRLNGPNEAIFTNWVTSCFPDRAEKVLNQLRNMRGGKLSDSRFGVRMTGEGAFADNIHKQFELARKRFMKPHPFPELRTDLFRVPDDSGQLALF